MKRLKVTHYLQDPGCCAIASSATVANYYNAEIDYESTKKVATEKVDKEALEEGLASEETCVLLNKLGFYKVTFVTSDLDLFDYTWEGFGRKKMIQVLQTSVATKKDKEDKRRTRKIIKWLKNYDYDNNLVISYDFGKYIRQHLNKKKPVLLSFNWTMFQKFAKDDEDSKPDPYNGDPICHQVAANGYDEKGLWIVDSHHQYYKYKRKKYRRGFYKISWENLMTCMGQGDVILPEECYIE